MRKKWIEQTLYSWKVWKSNDWSGKLVRVAFVNNLFWEGEGREWFSGELVCREFGCCMLRPKLVYKVAVVFVRRLNIIAWSLGLRCTRKNNSCKKKKCKENCEWFQTCWITVSISCLFVFIISLSRTLLW